MAQIILATYIVIQCLIRNLLNPLFLQHELHSLTYYIYMQCRMSVLISDWICNVSPHHQCKYVVSITPAVVFGIAELHGVSVFGHHVRQW